MTYTLSDEEGVAACDLCGRSDDHRHDPDEYGFHWPEPEEEGCWPIAVYGTLRPGFGNDRLWRERATASEGTGTVPGYRLVSNGGFPYAIPAEPDQAAVVSLVWPNADEYDRVLASMDRLEGVPHHYTREEVLVLLSDGSGMVAWMYVPADPEHYEGLRPVPGNDWAQAERFRWWEDDE